LVAEEYDDNLHEEVHHLHNQVHPYVPPGVVEMDTDDEDEDPKMEIDDSGDDATDGSSVDNDHHE
jgi:hypothetical protein